MPKPIYIDRLQVRNSSLVVFSEPLEGRQYNSSHANFNAENQQKTYTGILTSHAAKRCRTAIDLLLQKSQPQRIFNPVAQKEHDFTINFITLTICQTQKILSEKEAYPILLKPFLQWLQRTQNVVDYVCKAEKQKNGQIHYHITTNKFIDYSEIRDKWNYLLRQQGFIEMYRNNQMAWHKKGFKPRPINYENENGFANLTQPKWTNERQLAAYKYGIKTNWSNPNTTDVHAVHKVENIENYLCGYMVKDEMENEKKVLKWQLKKRQIEEETYKIEMQKLLKKISDEYKDWGKVWRCSESLRGKKHYTIDLPNFTTELIEKAEKFELCKTVEVPNCKFIKIAKNKGFEYLPNDDILLREKYLFDDEKKCNEQKRSADEIDKIRIAFIDEETKYNSIKIKCDEAIEEHFFQSQLQLLLQPDLV